MQTDDIVSREARNIASDARTQGDLSDTEAEILRDLLNSSEAFDLLVTAQQAAVYVNADDQDIPNGLDELAREGAQPLGEAIDALVEDRKCRAIEIEALADALEEPWGAARTLYRAGYETVDDLRGVEQAELIDAGVPNSTAARVTAALNRGGI